MSLNYRASLAVTYREGFASPPDVHCTVSMVPHSRTAEEISRSAVFAREHHISNLLFIVYEFL